MDVDLNVLGTAVVDRVCYHIDSADRYHSRQLWRPSREHEVPEEAVEANSSLRPHEQQPSTQSPHWTGTLWFAVWTTRTPSCRQGRCRSLKQESGHPAQSVSE
jgi:hypothetical protein